MRDVRVTLAVATLLRIFLEDPVEPRYGYDLMRLTGYPSGKLYPLLARLESAGWLHKEIERVDPSVAGRPARRHYRLSGEGLVAARRALAAVNEQVRLRPDGGPAPRPAASTP
ncbi:PadR family transcriptional regulator [Catenulispora subtropica]|uniref:Transcription regulator PadR N-terminal domain-containing protein n=1 Tax=Catenulispora subtropica TaxID=450798 RepID=A0ABN2TFI8_9ACTN